MRSVYMPFARVYVRRAGPVKAGHKPKLNRVDCYPEDDWNLAGRRLRRQCRGGAGGDNHVQITFWTEGLSPTRTLDQKP
jgi:hypothetical protein